MVIEKTTHASYNCNAWNSTLTLEIDEFTTVQDIKRMVGNAMGKDQLKADFIFDGRKLDDKLASAGSLGLQQGEIVYMLMKPPRGKW